jgi:hypothetical protein
MEFFLPGLFLFLTSIAITAVLAPKATPLMASLLSIAFLTYGVYHHYRLFAAEYRLATWQEGLKLYAPAVMIIGVILVVLYGVLSFFTSGQVPVPSLPNVSLPSANSLTSTITNSMETAVNSMNNMLSLGNNGNGNNKRNNTSLMNSLGNSLGLNGNKGNKGSNGNKGGITRSFLETV